MQIKLRGPVEHSPSKPNLNIFADPDYQNICTFQISNSHWTAAAINLLFSRLFRTGSTLSLCKVSSLGDKPFYFLAQKLPNFAHTKNWQNNVCKMLVVFPDL